MDADLTVDDELQPSEPHAGVRDLGKGESLVGSSHIHHDLTRHIGHGVQLGLLDDEVEDPVIDVAGIALGAGDGHRRDRWPAPSCLSRCRRPLECPALAQ